jgi:hypothetical protein
MISKRRLEGEVTIDHRDSPGVDAALAHRIGLPQVGAGQRYESASFGCSHCQRQVIMNPKRTRERGYCRKCDRYLCDECTQIAHETKQCIPMKKILDEAQEAAFRAEQAGGGLIITNSNLEHIRRGING